MPGKEKNTLGILFPPLAERKRAYSPSREIRLLLTLADRHGARTCIRGRIMTRSRRTVSTRTTRELPTGGYIYTHSGGKAECREQQQRPSKRGWKISLCITRVRCARFSFSLSGFFLLLHLPLVRLSRFQYISHSFLPILSLSCSPSFSLCRGTTLSLSLSLSLSGALRA